MTGWTVADQAELDVLLHALTTGYEAHRQTCEACQPCDVLGAWRAHRIECKACGGYAPLTNGPPCELRAKWLDHNRRGCKRCLPCASLRTAIAAVLDWREARALLSRAQVLRAQIEERAG